MRIIPNVANIQEPLLKALEAARLRKYGSPPQSARQLALVCTKIEEALLWLQASEEPDLLVDPANPAPYVSP